MIKKIVILVVLVAVLVCPSVLADETPVPTTEKGNDGVIWWGLLVSPAFINGGIVEIDYEIITTEVEIGGEFLFNISLTNITDSEAVVYDLHGNFLNQFIEGYHNPEDPYYDSEYTVEPNETIYFELKGVVSDRFFKYGYWRKEGDEFFCDFNIGVSIYTQGKYCLYYHDDFIPIKFTNIYDGSEFIEYEWIDDKDTVYYCDAIDYDFQYKPDEFISSEVLYKKMFICYDIYYKNISNDILTETKQNVIYGGLDNNTIKPGNSKTAYELYKIHSVDNVMSDETEIVHRWQFTVDGKYYGVEAKRTYKTKYVEMPQVSVEVNKVDKPDSKYEYNYEFIIRNTSKLPIENLFVITTNDHQDIKGGTLRPEESWQLEGGYDYEYGYNQIRVGYLLDGMFLWWPDYDENLEDNKIILELRTHERYYFEETILDYENMGKREEVITQHSPTLTLSPSPAVTPTPTPTPSPSLASDENNQSDWTVWLVILLGIIIFALIALPDGETKHTNKKE